MVDMMRGGARGPVRFEELTWWGGVVDQSAKKIAVRLEEDRSVALASVKRSGEMSRL